MALICDPTTKLNVLAQVASQKLSSSFDPKHQDTESDDSVSFPDLNEVKPAKPAAAAVIPHEANELSAIEEDSPNPIQYLEQLFFRHGIRFSQRRSKLPKSAIPRPSLEEIEAYSKETAMAVRNGDLDKLRELYYEKGFSLSACNRFGESLLHTCCRRGYAKMVKFMIEEAKVNPRVIDDTGRTPFHDVCWSAQPNLETAEILLHALPPIGLLLQDCRGHSPLQYAPRKHWGVWLEFLQEREHVFVNWIQERKLKSVEVQKLQRQPRRETPLPVSKEAPTRRVFEMNPSA